MVFNKEQSLNKILIVWYCIQKRGKSNSLEEIVLNIYTKNKVIFNIDTNYIR